MKYILGAAAILSMIAGTAMAAPMSQASGKTCVGIVASSWYRGLIFFKPILQKNGTTNVGVWIDYSGAYQNRPEPTPGTPKEGEFSMQIGAEKLAFTTIKGAIYDIHFDGTSVVGKVNRVYGGLVDVTFPCHVSAPI
jgi:hypothetical protein